MYVKLAILLCKIFTSSSIFISSLNLNPISFKIQIKSDPVTKHRITISEASAQKFGNHFLHFTYSILISKNSNKVINSNSHANELNFINIFSAGIQIYFCHSVCSC